MVMVTTALTEAVMEMVTMHTLTDTVMVMAMATIALTDAVMVMVTTL